jgi:hypothetical protein
MGSNLNVMIGGEAGQGVQSLGFILAKSLARGGYHVFADQDYESRIRGGHNFFWVRVSDSQIAAPRWINWCSILWLEYGWPSAPSRNARQALKTPLTTGGLPLHYRNRRHNLLSLTPREA